MSEGPRGPANGRPQLLWRALFVLLLLQDESRTTDTLNSQRWWHFLMWATNDKGSSRRRQITPPLHASSASFLSSSFKSYWSLWRKKWTTSEKLRATRKQLSVGRQTARNFFAALWMSTPPGSTLPHKKRFRGDFLCDENMQQLLNLYSQCSSQNSLNDKLSLVSACFDKLSVQTQQFLGKYLRSLYLVGLAGTNQSIQGSISIFILRKRTQELRIVWHFGTAKTHFREWEQTLHPKYREAPLDIPSLSLWTEYTRGVLGATLWKAKTFTLFIFHSLWMTFIRMHLKLYTLFCLRNSLMCIVPKLHILLKFDDFTFYQW